MPRQNLDLDQRVASDTIKQKRRQIEKLEKEINDIAKDFIDDFHFMFFAVSTFWECEKSPIGMCVFHLDDKCRKTTCRYCGGPVERK